MILREHSYLMYLFTLYIVLGLFKHSQGIARSYLADVYPKDQQSTVFGRFNSASSIGFIVGPAIGGHLADLKGGFYVAATLTTAIFMFTSGNINIYMINKSFNVKMYNIKINIII